MTWDERAKAALDNNGDDLLVKIEHLLSIFGVRKPEYILVTAVENYIYLRAAILLAATDERFSQRLTSELYTAVAKIYVAKKYLATTKRVESSITQGVDAAWNHGSNEIWMKCFGFSPDNKKKCPTNLQFIEGIAKAIV